MRLIATVLAAGAGTRFGGNKLAALFRGEPLIDHAVRAARAAPVERVIVVCSPALALRDWEGVPRVDKLTLASANLSDSLKAAFSAAGEVEGMFVFLGDMPLVPHGVAARLLPIFSSQVAAFPRFAGQPGHPVLLRRTAFGELAGLTGDEGAGRWLRGRRDVASIDVDDEGVVFDVDRAEDLRALAGRKGVPRAGDPT